MSRREMIQLLRRVIQEGVRAIEESEATVSFEEAAWVSVEARAGRRPTTLRDLRHFVRRLLRVDEVGEQKLRHMNSEQCRRLLKKAFGRSAHSYRKGRAILHSIFAWGQRHGYCSSNPVDSITAPEVKEKPIVPLTLEEVDRLQAAAELPEHRDMKLALELMLYCGVRPAEVQRLKPEDIYWQEKELIIRPQCSKTGGGRVIPLRRVCKPIGTQTRIAPANWEQRWRALREAAGLGGKCWMPDVCRHTFASYHAAYFRNLPALQLEMGHRDSMLLRTRYVSPIRKDAARTFWLKHTKRPVR